MQMRTLEIANTILGKIKKIQVSIEKLEKASTKPEALTVQFGGQGSIPLSIDIKEGIISDSIKKLGIQKAKLQTEFDELDDLVVENS